jgi:transcriptional regulator with XRE-family HTH domain
VTEEARGRGQGPSREDYFPIRGREVRRLRRQRGLSMRALSRETGLSKNTVRKIEAASDNDRPQGDL